MKQAELARVLSVTPTWFCAVINGRGDAGKDFAAKVTAMVGGDMAVWMLAEKRKLRRKIVAKFLAATNSEREGQQ